MQVLSNKSELASRLLLKFTKLLSYPNYRVFIFLHPSSCKHQDTNLPALKHTPHKVQHV